MLEKIRLAKYSKPPVLLYTSSGAVYGGDIPNGVVTDATVPAPQGSYGVQKLVSLAQIQLHGYLYHSSTLVLKKAKSYIMCQTRFVNISATTIRAVDGSMLGLFACRRSWSDLGHQILPLAHTLVA